MAQEPASIGRMRRRLVLEAPVASPDGLGGATQVFEAVAALWAQVEWISGTEAWRQGRFDIGTLPGRDLVEMEDAVLVELLLVHRSDALDLDEPIRLAAARGGKRVRQPARRLSGGRRSAPLVRHLRGGRRFAVVTTTPDLAAPIATRAATPVPVVCDACGFAGNR